MDEKVLGRKPPSLRIQICRAIDQLPLNSVALCVFEYEFRRLSDERVFLQEDSSAQLNERQWLAKAISQAFSCKLRWNDPQFQRRLGLRTVSRDFLDSLVSAFDLVEDDCVMRFLEEIRKFSETFVQAIEVAFFSYASQLPVVEQNP